MSERYKIEELELKVDQLNEQLNDSQNEKDYLRRRNDMFRSQLEEAFELLEFYREFYSKHRFCREGEHSDVLV